MAAAPTSSFLTSMSPQPPRTVQALVNEEARAPPPVRLYPSQHRVSMTRYATSTDPRGYIPVFEYPLNGQYIMIDCETGMLLGMVHFTGIWKALGHTKADVVKLVESDPTIAPYLRKVRGGYLKIQGTWLPFETAQTLARRVAWQIRYDLIPLFGPEFPDARFGQLLLSAPKPRGRRGTKKTAAATTLAHERTASPHESQHLSRPAAYGSQDSLGNRRMEAAGTLNGYPSMLPSQTRYSPYTRAATHHRTTQLDPLPDLIQPTQGCSHPGAAMDPIYSTHYHHHQTPRPSLIASHLAGQYSQHPTTASQQVPGIGSAAPPLPSMRHYQSHPTENNFFETYRGPDSFEALSNKWLAPEVSNSANLNDPGLFNGDMQYSNNGTSIPRKASSASHSNQYHFGSQMDSTSSAQHHRDTIQQQHHVHSNAGYTYDAQHDMNVRYKVTVEGRGQQETAPGEQAAGASGSSTYDQGCPTDAAGSSQSGYAGAVSYAQPSTTAMGNARSGSSPGSHVSHPAKSPTPSAASTSTHNMQHSHNPNNSNCSPSNTNSHPSTNNTLHNNPSLGPSSAEPQNKDPIQFAVLSSPALLDTNPTPDSDPPPS
ncbi:hypothetical protein VP01_1299g1 [Puccinia sorghi]|uniref:HTH APSES-type domain-containing protein n=1 Tax=Puccinia sorghi TaxID=27349 RepID=A0A0L6VPX5_9BASI|nr:hypothetical protein VP01_1299g1 [Puccinia sorghi]